MQSATGIRRAQLDRERDHGYPLARAGAEDVDPRYNPDVLLSPDALEGLAVPDASTEPGDEQAEASACRSQQGTDFVEVKLQGSDDFVRQADVAVLREQLVSQLKRLETDFHRMAHQQTIATVQTVVPAVPRKSSCRGGQRPPSERRMSSDPFASEPGSQALSLSLGGRLTTSAEPTCTSQASRERETTSTQMNALDRSTSRRRTAIRAVGLSNQLRHTTITSVMSNANHGGRAARILFFLGGLHEFEKRWQTRLYVAVWLLAGASCGAVCWANVWFARLPSHNVPTDLLTAYVHFPALQGWWFWRSRLRDVEFQSVVDSLKAASSEDKSRFALRIRWLSRAVLGVCIGFTAIVICAYQLPIRLENSRQVDDTYEIASSFMWWHEGIMLVTALPVVFALVTSYSMFIFFCMLHDVDFRSTKNKLVARIPQLIKEEAAGLAVLARSARFVASVESVSLASQARLDYTCHQWSWLGLHLLIFALCQIMVVVANVESFLVGFSYDRGDPYYWWWVLQDIFHGVGGLVLNAIYFTFMTHVTRSCEKATVSLTDALRDCGASHAVRTQTSALLAASMKGAHIFALNFNMENSVTFTWALVCTLWASAVTIMCDRNYWRDPSARSEEMVVACPCLNTYELSGYLVPGGVAATYPAAGVAFTYPYSYGMACAAHDYALPPFCNGTTLDQVEKWCPLSWCFVSEACGAGKLASVVFPGMWYSYSACPHTDMANLASVGGASGARRNGRA